MSLITPDFGLFFWMVVSFGLLVLIMRRFAWGPILSTLRQREDTITSALEEASRAREEISSLEQKREEIQRAAQRDRDQILAEARGVREGIIEAAREEARKQAEQLVEAATQRMRMEQEELRRRMRGEVLDAAMAVTERILRDRLQHDQAQAAHIDRILDEVLTPHHRA